MIICKRPDPLNDNNNSNNNNGVRGVTGQKKEKKEKEKEERKILRVAGGLVDNPKVVQEVLVDLKRNVTLRRCLIPQFFFQMIWIIRMEQPVANRM